MLDTEVGCLRHFPESDESDNSAESVEDFNLAFAAATASAARQEPSELRTASSTSELHTANSIAAFRTSIAARTAIAASGRLERSSTAIVVDYYLGSPSSADRSIGFAVTDYPDYTSMMSLQ